MTVKLIATAAALAFAGSAAHAQADAGKFRFGITGGTLGIGPEVSLRFAERFGVRGSATFFNYDRDETIEDIAYNGKLKLNNYGGTVDVYPFAGGFRISGGARIVDSSVRLRASPTQAVEVGDVRYTPAQIGTLSGTVRPKDFAPTATIGFGGNMRPGFNISFDVGVMFQGSPQIENLNATGVLANDPQFRASLEREEAEIEDDISGFKYYPIVQLSLGYRF